MNKVVKFCFLSTLISIIMALIPTFNAFDQLLILTYNASAENKNHPPVRFKMPEGESQGSPNKRSDTGTRGECPPLEPPLTALVPINSPILTSTKYPTFWFYVPYPEIQGLEAKFLFNAKPPRKKQDKVYRVQFLLENTPGIIRVTLPETVSPLEIDRQYSWAFAVICDPKDSSQNITVSGEVRRKSISELESELGAAALGRDRAIIYAANGFWLDSLTSLAEMRLAKPQDETVKTDWEDLLGAEAVKLDEFSDKPIVDCCTVE
ncbi:MAG: DUF928 domain-containing protein [Okeania sp. SIO3I5]|uniref:DUF928 domain-containing protein n=1 Tax=Okeania sp. SIO3I5 TaxID=2607805 RepID=UPI0013BE0061|nr:DUF928 domain-containing protein [Okeania sp. SIO3I5]NEQ37225.1 DUF928 domain-containing protein [Okeania sp. SIO3I5]